LQGRALILHALDRFTPQVDDVLISANRSLDRYQALGYRVVTDRYPGFAGPLAGLHAALPLARHELVATAPCDCPWLPLDLVARLRVALEAQRVDIVVASAGGRAHPVFCLCRRDVWDSLDAFLASGERKVEDWYRRLSYAEASFADQPQAFRNLNSPTDLRR
jgi:molybdopterin-guanine dinucleotide biosynthesis protein A